MARFRHHRRETVHHPESGRAGIVRISGPEAAAIAGQVFRSASGRAFELTAKRSHRVFFGRIVDPRTGNLIDEVLLTWLAAPHSLPTEDTVG